MQTQWQTDSGRLCGLNYAGVRADLDETQTPPDQRPAIWLGIKACERAVLDVMAEKQQQQANQG